MNGADHQAANSQPKQARKYLVKVLACSTWSCTPSRRAALRCSLESASASSGLVGLTSRAKAVAVGTTSCSSSSRWPYLHVHPVTPVMLSPGRCRLATRPSLLGPARISLLQHSMRRIPPVVAAWPIEAGNQPAWTEAYLRVRSNPWPRVTDVVRAENKTSSRL